EADAVARAGGATEEVVPAEKQHASGDGVLEGAKVDWLGDRGDRRARPVDRARVWVGVQHAQLDPIGQVIARRVDTCGSPEGAQTGLDRGELGTYLVDGLTTSQPDSGTPTPHIDHGRH